MKRLKFLSLFILLCFQFVFAGVLEISMEDSSAQGLPGNAYILDAYVHNASAAPVVVKALRALNDIPAGWTTSLCFGTSCYPPFVDEATEMILPGDSMFFDITFNTDSIPASGSVKMVFEDILSGYKDSVLFRVQTLYPPSFKLVVLDSVGEVNAGLSYPLQAYIYNLSDNPLTLQAIRLTNDIPSGWNTNLLLGYTSHGFDDSVATEILQPADSLLFEITFHTSGITDSGSARIAFEDLDSGQREEHTFKVVTNPVAPAFEITFQDSSVNGPTGSELVAGGIILNLTDSTITVHMLRETNQIPDDWQSSLSLGSIKYDSEVDSASAAIAAGDSLYFNIHFLTGMIADNGKTTLAFTSNGSTDTLRQTVYAETFINDIEGTETQLAASFELRNNYPNPFNSATIIAFTAPQQAGHGQFEVYNSAGQLVSEKTLTNLSAGLNQILFDGADLPSGVYLYRLKVVVAGGKQYSAAKKFILLR